MAIFRVGTQASLIEFARDRGWLYIAERPSIGVQPAGEALLPAVRCADVRGSSWLAPRRVSWNAPELIRIPDGVIHGGNLSLIVDGNVFPCGFAHSFQGSPAWRWLSSSEIEYEPPFPVLLDLPSPRMFGMVGHFGHFFVDALERGLAMESTDKTFDYSLLVGDANMLGLQPEVDEVAAIPQVSELVAALGWAHWRSRWHSLGRHQDWRVKDLHLWTLGAEKPAVPAYAMRVVRRRLSPFLEGTWTAAHSDGGRPLFVGRSDIRKRFIVGQEALLQSLREDYHLRTVLPEYLRLSVAAQSFAGASAVLLPIGSAKFNLAFCRVGTPVVCIVPRGYARADGGVVGMVRHLCHALDLPLAFYEVDIEARLPLINSNLILRTEDIDPMLDLVDELREGR